MARLAKWTQAARLGCILGLFAVAYLAFSQTRSELYAAETSRQERDLKSIFRSVETGGSIDPRTTSLAKTALSLNALESQALMQVWLGTVDKENGLQSRLLFALAGQVSRRSLSYLAADLLTAAQIEDVPGVVRAFDRMASLSPTMRASLTELAVPLLDDPEGARLLASHSSRPWFTQFVITAIKQPDRLDQVVGFLNSAKISNPEIRTRLLEGVVKRFLHFNKVAEAQAFAISFGKLGRTEFNNLRFEQQNSDFINSLLAWRYPNLAAQPTLQANNDLQFSIKNGIGEQPIAEKMFFFQPGRHRIESKAEFIGPVGDTLLSWRINCGALPVKQVSGLEYANANKEFLLVLEFEAPKQCTGYKLSLVLSEQSGQVGQLILRLGIPTKVPK